MKEKHKSREEGLKKIHDNFISYKKQRFDVKNMYDLIKNEYEEKLKNNELNFKLERVYIKMKMGWELDDFSKAFTNAIIGLIFGVFLIGIQQNLKESSNFNISLAGLVIAAIVVGSIFLLVNKKSFIRDYNEKIYYKICLDVLDELENNLNRQ